MIIAVDLDGTAWDENWPDIGRFRPNFIRVMRRLWNEGHLIIINSLRDVGTEEYDDAVDHLEIKDIKYHKFNENLPGIVDHWGESRKIGAHVYIDDRSCGWLPDGIPHDWEDIYAMLQSHPLYSEDRTHNEKLHHLLKETV